MKNDLTTKRLGPNDFLSYTTKQIWTILPTPNGYVAVCDDLMLTIEGDTISECQGLAEEAESCLLDELKGDNMSITEYIATLNYYKVANQIGGSDV